jgi:hypothetical protein
VTALIVATLADALHATECGMEDIDSLNSCSLPTWTRFVGCLSERRGCCASAWECLLEDSRRLLPPLRRFALRVPRRTPVNFGRTVPSKRQMLRGS